MDKTIRKNEKCIIGLPACDYVFSSTRSCFIGFGFKESSLEMDNLRHILTDKSIEPIEASGKLAPGQNAYCQKICSKIITSQFCIILLNNDENGGKEIPNANVNMEYGLMLGFNKYVIPFQRETQKLPFNVAGLDTIKYKPENFEAKAGDAIDQAIVETRQEELAAVDLDQHISTFLLVKRTLYAKIRNEGEQNIFDLGEPFGFNLLTDFGGLAYIYLGNFTALRTEVVIWRLRMLAEVLNDRFNNTSERIKLGLATPQQLEAINMFQNKLQVWVIVSTDHDRDTIKEFMTKYAYKNDVYSLSDVKNEFEKLNEVKK